MGAFHGLTHMRRWRRQFSALGVDPGAIHVHHGAKGAVGAGDFVPERKAGAVAAEFGDEHIDKKRIAGAHLFSENGFFAKQDRAEMLLDHQLGRNTVRRQEFHPGRGPKIVINGMPQVKIRVQIGPAQGNGDFEFRHVLMSEWENE